MSKLLGYQRLGVLSALAVMLSLTGCSTKLKTEGEPEEPLFIAERMIDPRVQPLSAVSDPWEGLNRRIYNFNSRADRWVLLPAVRGYRFIFPQFMRTGFRNIFDTVGDVVTFANQLLQFKPKQAGHTTVRVAANLTFGLLGTIDAASAMELPKYQEDFGQTLGRWGVGTGPYVVLPLYGPSNLRDAVGLIPDTLLQNYIWDQILSDDDGYTAERNAVRVILQTLDARDRVAFRYHSTTSPFEYELVRLLAATKRQLDVEK
ncbi:MAG: MlaA family lipoprotein [Gammaproteobacteria bacterium]